MEDESRVTRHEAPRRLTVQWIVIPAVIAVAVAVAIVLGLLL